MRAGVFALPSAKQPGRLALLVGTDLPAVKFEQDASAQTWKTDFTVLARVKDAEGEIIRKASQPYKLNGPAAQLEPAKRGDVLFFRQPSLPPGTYTLEAVVHDALDRRRARRRCRSSCRRRSRARWLRAAC